MAKRKRLTPARPDFLGDTGGAPETKSMFSPPVSPAPIAQVAGDSATTAALEEVTQAMREAREEGRLVQMLPLDAIEIAYLVRDRLVTDDDELETLKQSMAARGQQTPIEVVPLEQGRYGLISGWRRLTALQQLLEQTGERKYARIRALLRQPETAADAYQAMVEENEIRVGLSYYERAQVVARAAEKGVYPGEREALRGLFSAASRAKRSKIGAFLILFHALNANLKFPTAIPERLGLTLAKALGEDARLGPRLSERLRKAAPETAEEEIAVLNRALKAGDRPASGKTAAKTPAAGTGAAGQKPATGEEIAPGVWLETTGGFLKPRLTLSGPAVDSGFRERLLDWLKSQ